MPAGPMRELIERSVEPTAEKMDGSARGCVAKIRMAGGGACPMLGADRLCQIQAELGEEYLSYSCATYPRIVHTVGGLGEKALCLSCPEAARLVLLDKDLMAPREERCSEVEWDDAAPGGPELPKFFWPIRAFAIGLVRNRAYLLWQRMFLLGTYCRRLDAMARGEVPRGFAAFQRDFAAAIAAGSLRDAMDTIPADLALQLDMVLQLAGLCRQRTAIGPRFIACVEAFKQGIGFRPGATMETLIGCYGEAYARYYAPFFAAHPHMLENYLTNTIFRRLFPFGAKDGKMAAAPVAAREFGLLACQFALVKGLLIGVAGCHREGFNEQHVIHTVQSAMKHF